MWQISYPPANVVSQGKYQGLCLLHLTGAFPSWHQVEVMTLTSLFLSYPAILQACGQRQWKRPTTKLNTWKGKEGLVWESKIDNVHWLIITGVCGFFLQVKFATSLLACLQGANLKIISSCLKIEILSLDHIVTLFCLVHRYQWICQIYSSLNRLVSRVYFTG